jgi:membrane associated rhomboid family serine protease
MDDDMRVVFESRNRVACADRSLVLTSSQIPHQIVEDAGTCVLVVPARFSTIATEEIWLYDEENPPVVVPPRKSLPHRNAVPGVIAYAMVLFLITGLAGSSYFGLDWVAAGRIDGALIRSGEWWRAITALTLHSGLRHLVGNLIFGTLFGLFAGRLLGSGIAWLAIIVTGASGNLLNTLLLESTHRSIGASTAVFAALGLVAGYVWRGKLMSQERWSYRVGPIVGGFALLMYTGTGDAQTDIGAHLFGFLSGFAGGMLLTLVGKRFFERKWQIGASVVALAIIIGAWAVAFDAVSAAF